MQGIRSSNPPVVTGSCDLNKSQAPHHHSLKFGSKLKYLNILIPSFVIQVVWQNQNAKKTKHKLVVRLKQAKIDI